jgi:transcriptional regulator with GAF, ATPase, and Fis domain
MGVAEIGNARYSRDDEKFPSGVAATNRRLEEEVKRAQFREDLYYRWTQTRAAALLGLNRDQIRYRIEKFKLERATFL